VYLFGEHAVVYGEPAVPCAIERRARVGVQRRDDGKLRVRADDLSLDGFTVEYDGTTEDGPDIDVSESLVSAAMGYVDGAIEQVREVTGEDDAGFDVTIESDIPSVPDWGPQRPSSLPRSTPRLENSASPRETAELAERAYQTESGFRTARPPGPTRSVPRPAARSVSRARTVARSRRRICRS